MSCCMKEQCQWSESCEIAKNNVVVDYCSRFEANMLAYEKWKKINAKMVKEKPKKLTNEEWFSSLNTEQKANFLYEIAFYSNLSDKWMNDAIMENIPAEDSIAMWLKSEHKE